MSNGNDRRRRNVYNITYTKNRQGYNDGTTVGPIILK